MTETAKRLLIAGAVLIAVAGATYIYISASASGRHQVEDF